MLRILLDFNYTYPYSFITNFRRISLLRNATPDPRRARIKIVTFIRYLPFKKRDIRAESALHQSGLVGVNTDVKLYQIRYKVDTTS